MDRVKLVAHPRTESGSRASRRLRKQGQIPGVFYSAGKAPVALAVDQHALREAVGTEAGLHAVLDLTLEGEKRGHIAIVKDYQLDKVKHVVIHVDFQEIRLDEPIESDVAVVAEGVAEGVKMGGILDLSLRMVSVSALPTDMPEHVTLNVEEMNIGDVARVSDLVAPENVRVLADPETVVCSVHAPRVAEVAEAEEAEAVEEAEAAAEAAAEAEAFGGEAAEPEATG